MPAGRGLDAADRRDRDRRRGRAGRGDARTGSTMFGRLGLLLTVHRRAPPTSSRLVGRGMAADPNRVPWGNMYEFTLTGTFVVVAGLPAAAQALRPVAGWARSSPAFVLVAADGRRAAGSTTRSRRCTEALQSLLAGDPRGRRRSSPPARSPSAASPRRSTWSRRAPRRGTGPTAATSPGCPRWPRWTGSPTGSTRSASRSGPSRC